MAKGSILTPVLAGVLGVSVIGSGVAYYNVYVKDSAKDENAKNGKKKDTSIALSVDEAAENIEAQIGKAQKIAKGEFDEGYKGTVTYTPPSGGQIGELGLKGITVGAEAKQKDKMSGMDYSVAYDSTNLLTVNVVYDNESETAYVKIPELSDAYLYGTTEEIESWVNDNMGNPMDSLKTANPIRGGGGDDFNDVIIEDSAYTETDPLVVPTMSAATPAPDLSALEDVDFSALFDDLATYVDTVKENAPEAKDADDYTVTNGSESITLTTKRYTITNEDAKKVVNAVAEKGKSDTTINDFFSKMGMSSEDIDGFWNSLTEEFNSESDETVTLDVYYNGDEIQGLKATPSDDSGESIYYVMASDKEKLIFDCKVNVDGSDDMTGSGLVTMKDDVMDGSLSVKSDEMEFTLTFNQLTATDDTLKGKMSIDGKAEEQTFNVNYEFDCSGNDSSITVSGSVAGEDIGTINVSTQQTDASDISVPTGTGYKLSDEQQLQSYAESCDIEGWMNTVKGALGDELYGQLFGSMAGMSGGSTDFDDYNFDDYNFDDEYSSDFKFDDGSELNVGA